MKPTLITSAAAALAAISLTGCVAVPVGEPVVYAAPPPPPVVVVRPAYRPYYHRHYAPHWRRGWYR